MKLCSSDNHGATLWLYKTIKINTYTVSHMLQYSVICKVMERCFFFQICISTQPMKDQSCGKKLTPRTYIGKCFLFWNMLFEILLFLVFFF